MPRQTHFEVHVLQRGRWGVHAQYPGHQKEQAVSEGRMLSNKQGIDEVKVIKEVFDPNEGVHHDYTIYKSTDARATSASAKQQASSSADGGGGGDNDDDWDDDGDYDGDWDDEEDERPVKRRGKPKKKSKLTTIIVKLLLVTLFSVCIAGLFTLMASTMLSGTTLFGVRIRGNAEANLLFIVFVGSFLMSAVGMAVNFLKGESIADMELPGGGRKPDAKAVAKAKDDRLARAEKAAEDKETKRKLKEAMKKAKETEEATITEKQVEAEAVNERLKDEIAKEPEQEKEPEAAAEPEAEAPPPESEEATDGMSANAQKQKAQMMKFLGDILDDAGTEKEKMDNFNKFGVNLFLAGACGSLSEKRDLDEASRAQVLADSVRVMGFKKSHAASFAGRYEEYLLQDPRYMQMFQAGRNSMNTYISDEAEGAKHLQTAIAEWYKPKGREEQSGPITVLFTDIAGSTAMTQALGDAGAQEVVRAHNRIVRAALTSCNGKEVKHTGDGIMASFTKTTDGVDASIQMQRETDVHNQQNPNLPLHLKIGLNSGEPIVEDNDLFGSTVQMSARIVDKAQADETFVSEVVRGICAGKSYTFINRGGYTMKGFDDDPILYEVEWRAQAAAE